MKYAIYVLLFNVLFIFKVNAQSGYRNQIGDRLDNDQYINPYHDRYYLAGQFINFTTVLNTSKDCAGLFGTTVVKKTLEIEVGQQIYGPFASWARDPTLQDRPYTGYLYAGAALNLLYDDESSLKITAQVGTIGPASLAERVQKAFHHAFDLKDPEGWQYQLNNEAGLNVEGQYTRLLYRSSNNWFDVAAIPSVRLGNTFSNATAAIQLRVGALDKLYQSASTNSKVSLGGDHQKTEFYLFAIPQLSYVAYNATIQGGMFIKDKGPVHFDAIPLIFTQQLGLQFASRRFSASYTAFLRSREVGSGSSALAHQWGSIAMAYRFGRN
ncbi:lipid A deacylase LpxR family protein [Mucilaginibacter calamicampi]|uniref:Lipid A deacylase LpxR family protein n=1 Tax=Mucilaginibacter calamicampi TaxID=1302352 RepID=A0ABW2YVQ4_9SPHI